MRKTLIILLFLTAFSGTALLAQEKGSSTGNDKILLKRESEINIKIFPVPVLNSMFTVTSDKPFVSIRMTNIIGQEVTREKFPFPQRRAEVYFTNAEKGIYVVTIELEDKTKIVRKILVDTSK